MKIFFNNSYYDVVLKHQKSLIRHYDNSLELSWENLSKKKQISYKKLYTKLSLRKTKAYTKLKGKTKSVNPKFETLHKSLFSSILHSLNFKHKIDKTSLFSKNEVGNYKILYFKGYTSYNNEIYSFKNTK